MADTSTGSAVEALEAIAARRRGTARNWSVTTAGDPQRTLISVVAERSEWLAERVTTAVVTADLDVHARDERTVTAIRTADGDLVTARTGSTSDTGSAVTETWLVLEADPVRDDGKLRQLRAAIAEAVCPGKQAGTGSAGGAPGLNRALSDLDGHRVANFLLRRLSGLGIDNTSAAESAVPETIHLMWDEHLRRVAVDRFGAELGQGRYERYRYALPGGYKGAHSPTAALTDLEAFEQLTPGHRLGTRMYRTAGGEIRLRIYRLGEPMELSDIVSVLHSFSVRVTDEHTYLVGRSDATINVYDFGLRFPPGSAELDEVADRMRSTFVAAWTGLVENDELNTLVLTAGLDRDQVVVLRAYTRFLIQAGVRYSAGYLAATLLAHPQIAAAIVDLFAIRFDPRSHGGRRDKTGTAAAAAMDAMLDEVASLDHDQILRMYRTMVLATLRTSAYQSADQPTDQPTGQPGQRPFAVKLDPRAIDLLPAPRPLFEIFVYAPRFEAVHLRFGRVARGGLRWSERREDFRTEILGLVKAQTVKNAGIVPTGAKGGFVLKTGSGPAEAAACYQQFIGALLDLTDNMVDGRVVPPAMTVRHDGDDPYLVVAADRGTATFSDLANAIALDRGFWLGDAFASGGSAGYDHKAMGITARGAWESAKAAFRERGVDIDVEPVTVVGIGDMSGDVFGNGMLCSRQIRLVAAFDHRSIFLDPDPDPAISYAERQRLFDLPRSSWADYDPALISPGGAVVSRAAKSVRLSPRVREVLGIDEQTPAELTPATVVKAILTAPVDLLFNGGIGTYVKASDEQHRQVGDKANDAVRVDGRQLRARVVCEGGNLGLTQRGRVEFAMAGGDVLTDFIDNSGGVDCSDHEVNIKIMLARAIATDQLDADKRNPLLASMTGEVAAKVLRDNYAQAAALRLARRHAGRLLPVHRRMIDEFERAGHLDRAIEGLPDDRALTERAAAAGGLTAPELAVLLAYVKILVGRQVAESDLPDQPWTDAALLDYFPTQIRQQYPQAAAEHPLRREIVTTSLVSEVINRAGITMVFRAVEETGCGAVDVVRAAVVVRDAFDLAEVWRGIEALDNRIPAAAQARALIEVRRFLDDAVRWLLTRRPLPLDVPAETARLRETVTGLLPKIDNLLPVRQRNRLAADVAAMVELGLVESVAAHVAALRHSAALLEVGTLTAGQAGNQAEHVARVHASVAEMLKVDVLLARVAELPRSDRWHAMAATALRCDLGAAVASLTARIVEVTPADLEPAERVERWAAGMRDQLAGVHGAIAGLDGDHSDLACLTVIARAVRTL